MLEDRKNLSAPPLEREDEVILLPLQVETKGGWDIGGVRCLCREYGTGRSVLA